LAQILSKKKKPLPTNASSPALHGWEKKQHQHQPLSAATMRALATKEIEEEHINHY
jgi:hypothetical protein